MQIELRDPISVGAGGRFISFGVSAAATNCFASHPLFDFSLLDGETEHRVSDRPIDACTDAKAQTYIVDGSEFKAGNYVSKGGTLLASDTFRWRMRNAQPLSRGNDGAIDQVTVVDSTPQLATEFGPGPIIGDTARMTVRVVNTSEKGRKSGWSFTEQLPANLHIAAEPKTTTTCANPTLGVKSGAQRISASGDLAYDMEDCTLSFDVAADAAGTYTVGTSNVVARTGLDLPADATVTFAAERNVLTVSEQPKLTGGNGDAIADLGENIAFSTAVRNDGNVAVDTLVATGTQGAVTCGADSLAPGASTTCTSAARPVTQQDIDAGAITDSVRIIARSRAGAQVSGSASASVATALAAPAMSLQLRSDSPTGGARVGETIGVQATATNSGNVSLQNLGVVITGRPDIVVSCPAVALAPRATVDCAVAGKYRVIQEDVDRGSVAFHATATGISPSGVEATGEASAVGVTVARAPAMTSVLSVSLVDTTARPGPGSRLHRSLHVTNSGNVTLNDLAGVMDGAAASDVVCPTAPLAPGASAECVLADYAVTQAEVDAGSVGFHAVVHALDPEGGKVSSHDRVSQPLNRERAMTVHTTATLDGPDAPRRGDSVRLRVTARNTGNTTLLAVRGTIRGHDKLTVTCPAGNVIPGGSVECAATGATLAQSEINAGTAIFRADMAGKTASGESVTAFDSASVALVRVAGIAVTASSALRPTLHEVPLTGDAVALTATVRNTGNVTIHDAAALVNGGEVSVAEGTRAHEAACAPRTLAPRTQAQCRVSSGRIAQQNIDMGHARFDVAVTATGPNAKTVEAHDTTTLALVRAPAIGIDLSAHRTPTAGALAHAGDAIVSSLFVKNIGNTSVQSISASIPAVGGAVTRPTGVIQPGARVECAAGHGVLTQENIEDGSVVVEVAVSATGPAQTVISAHDATHITLDAASALDMSSAAVAPSGLPARAGESVGVRYRVVNTGNLTVARLRWNPDMAAAATCKTERLAPGESTECSLVHDHIVSTAEGNAGEVVLLGQAVGDASRPNSDGSVIAPHERADRAKGTPVSVSSQIVRTRISAAPAPAPAQLAFTGSELVAMAMPVGVLLLLAGMVFLMAARRHRPEDGRGNE